MESISNANRLKFLRFYCDTNFSLSRESYGNNPSNLFLYLKNNFSQLLSVGRSLGYSDTETINCFKESITEQIMQSKTIREGNKQLMVDTFLKSFKKLDKKALESCKEEIEYLERDQENSQKLLNSALKLVAKFGKYNSATKAIIGFRPGQTRVDDIPLPAIILRSGKKDPQPTHEEFLAVAEELFDYLFPKENVTNQEFLDFFEAKVLAIKSQYPQGFVCNEFVVKHLQEVVSTHNEKIKLNKKTIQTLKDRKEILEKSLLPQDEEQYPVNILENEDEDVGDSFNETSGDQVTQDIIATNNSKNEDEDVGDSFNKTFGDQAIQDIIATNNSEKENQEVINSLNKTFGHQAIQDIIAANKSYHEAFNKKQKQQLSASRQEEKQQKPKQDFKKKAEEEIKNSEEHKRDLFESAIPEGAFKLKSGDNKTWQTRDGHRVYELRNTDGLGSRSFGAYNKKTNKFKIILELDQHYKADLNKNKSLKAQIENTVAFPTIQNTVAFSGALNNNTQLGKR